MALAFRTNGAPLSGALFVSNPGKPRANRATRRAKARKSTKAARSNGSKRRSSKRRKSARRNTAAKAPRANRRRARKNKRTVASYFGKARPNKGKRRARRNAGGFYMKRNTRAIRRYRRVRRNNGEGGGSLGFLNPITSRVKALVAKVPLVGGVVASYIAPVLVGAGVGAVHYFGMKALESAAPGIVRPVNAIKFTLLGAAVYGVLSTNLPGINKIPAGLRSQLATGALLVGGGLDAFRALSDRMGDLGDAVALYDYSDPTPLYDYSGAYGDGGYYDVVPMRGMSTHYSGAREGDALYAPDDLAQDEGEAALAGIAAWSQTFGLEPRVQSSLATPYSALAGQPGHRWGWLIKLIGFEKFQQVAALPPEQRQSYLAALKAEALRLADAQAVQPQAPVTPANGARVPNTSPTPMSGIGMDFGSPLYAGSVFSGAM
jgi:hypothetical protein